MTERYAIYYAPARPDPLWLRACAWLGRDAATASPPPTTDIAGVSQARRHDVTVSARRYGFHATLKPPMALAGGTEAPELLAALGAFCAAHPPVMIGRLTPRLLGGFLALMPEEQVSELSNFAAECVVQFDGFRAGASRAERDRRLAHGLTARQLELLDTYGYPYVLEEYRFHMTLTDRLAEGDRAEIVAAAEAWFGPVLDRTHMLDRVVLFHEPEPGAPFARLAEFELGQVHAG